MEGHRPLLRPGTEIDYHQLGFRLIFTAPISALEPVGVPPLKQEPHTDNAVAQAL